MKPETLWFEYFPESPINSFLLLDLAELQPSGIYELQEGARAEFSEELVELAPGEYADRQIWDSGFITHDEQGREVPLPRESRLVIRWLKGKILIVAKGSLWNGAPETYDGRHTRMTAADIRSTITRALGGRQSIPNR